MKSCLSDHSSVRLYAYPSLFSQKLLFFQVFFLKPGTVFQVNVWKIVAGRYLKKILISLKLVQKEPNWASK